MKLTTRWILLPVVATLYSAAAAWSPSTPAKSLQLIGLSRRAADKKTNTNTTKANAKTKANSNSNSNATFLQSTNVPTAEQDASSDASPEVTPATALTDTKQYSLSSALQSSELQMAVSVFSGTVVTFCLNNFLGMGPIPASSVAGLLATLILPEKFALAAFCGSFAGMAKTTVIPNLEASAILGVVCAGTLALFDSKKWLVGVGGRLGFVAQLACTSQFLLSSLFFLPPPTAKLIGGYPGLAKGLAQCLPTAISTIVGALFMSAWKECISMTAPESKQRSATTATATTATATATPTTTITTTTIRQFVAPRLSNSVAAVSATGLWASLCFSSSVAGPAFVGAFIAMSSPARLETYGSVVGASLLAGVSQTLVLSGLLQGGWGGKLGTAALMGVVLYRALVTAVTPSNAHTNATATATATTMPPPPPPPLTKSLNVL